MPGRSRLMCAARATHTENDKPVENAPMYQGADLLHRHPCDNHSGPVQYAVSLMENRTLWWRRNAARGCKLITCSPLQAKAATKVTAASRPPVHLSTMCPMPGIMQPCPSR